MNTNSKGTQLIENICLSIMDASFIKSKWQANFMQIFPLEYNKLPKIHELDKKCFDNNWKGDDYTTYEQFMKEYYKGWL